ncbi:MAG: acyl-CoA thioesterase [Bacteroidales bacterium]|jgi:acyl-CoA thioester hydrolase
MEIYKHETEIQLRFNDIDMLGHVSNSIYQNYFDLARTAYFKQALSSPINWKETALVLASIKIDYKKPIFFDEQVSVVTRVYHLGNKSLKMHQKLINKITREEHAINDAVLVAFNFNNNQPVLVPEMWKEEISQFED